jgi:hypothetical protein
MFQSRPLPPQVLTALGHLPADEALAILNVFDDYARLLKAANRDREAVLGFVDGLNRRLDELHADPEVAREQAYAWAQTAIGI